MRKTWGDRAKETIWRVLDGMPAATLQEKRRALRQAYPFGPRKYWPYKVWCQEVRKALHRPPLMRVRPGQVPLFDLADDG